MAELGWNGLELVDVEVGGDSRVVCDVFAQRLERLVLCKLCKYVELCSEEDGNLFRKLKIRFKNTLYN